MAEVQTKVTAEEVEAKNLETKDQLKTSQKPSETDATPPKASPVNNENIEVHMLRQNLANLPLHLPPKGFSLVQQPSKDDWVAIQTAAEPFLKISATGLQEGSYEHEFEAGQGNLPAEVDQKEALSYQFFLVDEATGQKVGTATAWRSCYHKEYHQLLSEQSTSVPCVDPNTDGLVHWVAIIPEYQGRGLAKCLLSAVMNSFLKIGGLKTCTLGTSSGRSMAIPLYLAFGFEPLIFSDRERNAWHAIRNGAAGMVDAGSEMSARMNKNCQLLLERLKGV